IGGVTVVVGEPGEVEITKGDGSFVFHKLPAGTYTLSFSLGDHADSTSVEVVAGETATADKTVDWDLSFAETITVYSASRQRERIVDAPAAVTVMSEEEIVRESASGQLPKVLEFTPGVEVTQSGINDFNLNTRGFPSSLTRRVQVIVDGRDPAVPILGSTEWGYLANQEGLASMELVRGPSAALYGKSAFNGVLNLITEAPKDAVGGRFTLTGGELSTIRGELGWAADLGSDWYLKFSGAYAEGDGFTKPRNVTTEYPGLPFERGAATNFQDSSDYKLRFDKHFGNGVLTLEGGFFDAEGYVVVTGIGRVDVNDVERTYTRLNYSANHFNILAYTNNRESPDQLALASGGRIFLETENQNIEVQGNGTFGKVRLVGGASYKEEDIDTSNFNGNQTLVFAPIESDSQAIFGQADIELNDKLKLVIAGRYDESSLHKSQVSPKAALVYGINSNNTLRFSYNEAFQVANYSEFFLDAPTAFPGNPPTAAIDLSGIEAALCTPFGVTCGFGTPVGVRALGNKDLELEEVTSWEIGYTGIFGSKAFLTVDYYASELDNFITDLTVNAFGSVNPNFGPYQPPAGHPLPALLLGTLAASLPPTVFPFLSNNVDGTPIFALVSYTNAGAVDTQGIDFGLSVYATPQWLLDFTYSWFDFDITELGFAGDELVANAPENKFAVGISYLGDKISGSLRYRWVDDFAWNAGAFQGPVPSYEVVNLSGDYAINDNVSIGINISNAFDDEHHESFGGDLVGRRGLGYARFTW
ncbi:MAG: TonB-dependent receptor, partial [bacterium]|nr:TonB-dependent receptor [bacterium]